MYQVEINRTGKWETVGTYKQENKAKLIGKALAIQYLIYSKSVET